MNTVVKSSSTCLILGGNFGNDLNDGSFKLLDADVLKDDCPLGEQPHICRYLFTLQPKRDCQLHLHTLRQVREDFNVDISKGFLEARASAYISVLDGKLNVISSLQSLQITLELAVVKEDLLHHIGPLDEPESLLKDDAWFKVTIQLKI